MAMGRKRQEVQETLWVATTQISEGPGHPFYRKFNAKLQEHGFDAFVEERCQRFYAADLGRPGIAPGVYFRMLMIGYLEGLDSERGIAWRWADSSSLKAFLGYRVTESTPDHSSLSVIRRRLDLETHQEVFAWILQVLSQEKLLAGKTVGVDSTTLEANAAMRSIVRRDTGESYDVFLTKLAVASGIATPTREELAKLDRKRKNKASNDDWQSPSDGDARITKMKDGRTHLAHKAEHAVDMEVGAVVAVTLQEAHLGDTTSMKQTLEEARENVQQASGDEVREVVGDKGYHSNEVMVELKEQELRSYISEPNRGVRDWEGKSQAKAGVYANRRRIRGNRGKRLLRRRGELLERSFAHCYETGAMRRTHLRGHENILKRLLVHVGAFNLSLIMRKLVGYGTPRGLRQAVLAWIRGIGMVLATSCRPLRPLPIPFAPFLRAASFVPYQLHAA
jgi:transposase